MFIPAIDMYLQHKPTSTATIYTNKIIRPNLHTCKYLWKNDFPMTFKTTAGKYTYPRLSDHTPLFSLPFQIQKNCRFSVIQVSFNYTVQWSLKRVNRRVSIPNLNVMMSKFMVIILNRIIAMLPSNAGMDWWRVKNIWQMTPLIARFMGPTWGPSGANRTQVGPMLAPWTFLSGS